MKEDDKELHVIITSPPSTYDVATIARTLYASLGPTGWKLTVLGIGRRLPARLIREAKIPVKVALSNIKTELNSSELVRRPVYLIDPRGVPAATLDQEPSTLVLNYGPGQLLARGLELDVDERVRGLGSPMLTYETAIIVYEFFVRRRKGTRPIVGRPSLSIRQAMYIARKILEAMNYFDNYILLEPNTIVFVVRRALLPHGMLVDPYKTEIKLDHVTGAVEETIIMDVYDSRTLLNVGKTILHFDGNLVVLETPQGRLEIAVDPSRRRACIGEDICVREGEDAETSIGEAVGNFFIH
jgi:hypothetical protein